MLRRFKKRDRELLEEFNREDGLAQEKLKAALKPAEEVERLGCEEYKTYIQILVEARKEYDTSSNLAWRSFCEKHNDLVDSLSFPQRLYYSIYLWWTYKLF
jgi:hypothetical protein